MLIGAMNHPQRDILGEIQWLAQLEGGPMDFIDLTLEPPAASSWLVDANDLRAALQRHHLPVVGHTPYYLPLASAIDELRQAAIVELLRCLKIFAQIGARWMNIHPDHHIPMHDRAYWNARNIESLREIFPLAKQLGVGLMIENLPGAYNTVNELAELLEPLPELGLHLDIGHANLQVPANTTEAILKTFGSRLRHVHLHDNKGGCADLHLPLGTGTIDIPQQIKLLKAAGYDGTITLEVFSPDQHYLIYSRGYLRKLWDRT